MRQHNAQENLEAINGLSLRSLEGRFAGEND
jgi:hypothetical protein